MSKIGIADIMPTDKTLGLRYANIPVRWYGDDGELINKEEILRLKRELMREMAPEIVIALCAGDDD